MDSAVTSRTIIRRGLAIVACMTLLLACVFTMPSTVEAYDTYNTDKYDVEITVNENNTYDIHEKIDVNFLDYHHGIFRYIPEVMSKVENVKVPDYDKKIYTESHNRVIQIGSADYSVIGQHAYDIYYKLVVFGDKNKGADMFSLDVIPTGWQTPIGDVNVKITMPKPAPLENIAIYSGPYGSKGNDNNVKVETSADGKTILLTAKNLPDRNGITLNLDLPEGYWVGETRPGALAPWQMILFAIGPVIAFLLWLYYGRDKKVIKTIEFYPPDDMTPGEMGYFIDGVADKKDLVSTIVYLADKGYLSIVPEGEKDFILKKIKRPKGEVPKYVDTFFVGLFSDSNKVRAKGLGRSFAIKYEQSVGELQDMFKGKNSRFTTQSVLARTVGIIVSTFPILALAVWETVSGIGLESIGIYIAAAAVLGAAILICKGVDNIGGKKRFKGILLLIAGMLLLNFGISGAFAGSPTLMYVDINKSLLISALVAIATIVSIFFAVVAKARTSTNTALLGRVLGFKDFISTAELDKLNKLVEEDPSYFYHILPYAYIFGLTNKWIKNFESIPIVKPEWIESDYVGFDAYMMGRMMSGWSSGVSHSIKIPTSDDSGGGDFGGFSGGGGGGGFSGGGFGGGGGGAW